MSSDADRAMLAENGDGGDNDLHHYGRRHVEGATDDEGRQYTAERVAEKLRELVNLARRGLLARWWRLPSGPPRRSWAARSSRQGR